MTRLRSATLALGLWVGLVPVARAASPLVCEGKLTYLAPDANGSVNIAIDEGVPVHGVCNTLAADGYRASPESCKAMYATFPAIRMAERSVRAYYNDPALTACSQVAAWSKQRSFYLRHVAVALQVGMEEAVEGEVGQPAVGTGSRIIKHRSLSARQSVSRHRGHAPWGVFQGQRISDA